VFQKAKKSQSKLRLALVGPSGSGKTYTALTIGKALGQPIAVIDTERGSASKYAGDVAEFDVCELETFSPKTYVEAIEVAAAEGYPVLIIDSLSHAWAGVEGALDQVDRRASSAAGKFGAWREVTPLHNALVDAILSYPGHVIATMRAKTEYVIEEVNGKKTVRKIGLAPIQRDGVEYEFDVVGDLDHAHVLTVTKTRCSALADRAIRHPGEDVAAELLAWLSDGAPAVPDQIVELVRRGDLVAAKEMATQHWKSLHRADRARVTAAIKAAEGQMAETREV